MRVKIQIEPEEVGLSPRIPRRRRDRPETERRLAADQRRRKSGVDRRREACDVTPVFIFKSSRR